MSVKVSSWVWHDPATADVNGNELVLLLALADVAGDEGRCRYMDDDSEMTYAALADKVRVDRRTIIRLVASLRRRGLVRQVPGQNGRPNEFTVVVPWAKATGDKLAPVDLADDLEPVTSDAEPVTSGARTGDISGVDTSLIRNNVRDVSTSEVETQGQRFAQPLCDVLAAELTANEVRFSITKAWLDAARLLVDRDGRDPFQAKALIEWACRDSFWAANIQSMPTFRKQYDKLRLSRERAQGGVKRSTVEHGRDVDALLAAEEAQQRLAVTA